jgi:hypothetical protein
LSKPYRQAAVTYFPSDVRNLGAVIEFRLCYFERSDFGYIAIFLTAVVDSCRSARIRPRWRRCQPRSAASRVRKRDQIEPIVETAVAHPLIVTLSILFFHRLTMKYRFIALHRKESAIDSMQSMIICKGPNFST